MSRPNTFGFYFATLLSLNLVACGDGDDRSRKPAAEGGTSAAGSAAGGTTASTQGGASKGGTSSIGGATTSASGGAGAVAGTTTSASGGAGAVAGTASTGGTTNVPCFTSFVIPADGAALSNLSDLDGVCSNGIQTNVIAVTNASSGTTATLHLTNGSGNTTEIATAVVGTNLQASFANVTLPSTGQSALTVRIGDASCSATETIKLDCAGTPACAVASPVISATHPFLNGVAATSGGDRVSNVGSPYQAAFTVNTDAANGQKVQLTLDGASSVESVVTSGKAQFAGVPLGADGTHTVQATCTSRSGLVASTATLSYPVDTAAPNLAVSKVLGGATPNETAVADGDHFAASDDADTSTNGLQLKFCASTTSSDAFGLDSVLSYQKNFCVALGGNNPSCVPVTASGNGGAGCTLLECPGNGAFDVAFTLYDAAGNPATVTRNNLTCASTAPSVSFIDPVAGTDPGKRILAATTATATRKDKNGSQAGAQYDVKICTSATAGTAKLSAGIVGSSLAEIATGTVTADTADLCQGNFPSTVTFADVTLPESVTNAAFNLAGATRLQVSVTDQNTAQGSASADIWVDSTIPVLTLNSPANFCDDYINSATSPVSQDVTFGTSIVPVSILVQHSDGTSSTASAASLSFYQATASVPFATGLNTLQATVAEPSGNSGNITDCQVTVGTSPPPKVTWSTPIASSLLTAPGNTATSAIADGSDSTAGWQGTLKACTDIDLAANPGATIQFSVDGTALGDPVVIVEADSKTCATLANATIPEGAAVRLTATTSDAVSVGSGRSSITVPVDVTIPSVPTTLTAAVKDRRQTSFELKWVAAADGAQRAAGYDIRIAKEAITEANFDNTAIAQSVPFSGIPAAAGSPDGIIVANRYIETDYYFALRAKDAVGNRSPILATSEKTRAEFKTTILEAPVPGLEFGATTDGTGDLNGDGLSDLVVGHLAGNRVYIYFGNPLGPASAPDVTIVSDNNTFGYQASPIGDLDGDGMLDLAISTWGVEAGRVSVFYGRETWPSVMTENEADVLVAPDTTQPGSSGFASSRFGYALGRIGDFNSDGIDDFAVGAYGYNSNKGHVSVVLGKDGGLAPVINVPQAFNTGQAIRIDGDSAFAGYFGLTLTGIGPWYAQPATPVLVVSAQTYGGNLGRLYAFAGVSGTPPSIAISSALNFVNGASKAYLGGATLQTGGDLGYAGKGAILVTDGSGKPGYVDVFSGTDAEGPFGRLIQYSTNEASTASIGFGRVVLGGGIPGTTTVTSILGDARADLVISTMVGAGPRLHIVNGSKVSPQFATPTAATIQSVADITYPMPSNWQEFSLSCRPTKDINGDGYGDIGVGDISYTNVNYDGRVLVLW